MLAPDQVLNQERYRNIETFDPEEVNLHPDDDLSLLELPIQLRQGTDIDHTSHEANLEIRQQLSKDRQAELDAEHARLEDQRHKIEQRRLEIEAERKFHAEECERLETEAAETKRKAEEAREQFERELLEKEAENERRQVAAKIAALEIERDRARAEEERLEKEAAAERERADERLRLLEAEKDRQRAEQERIELEAKEELARAEERLLHISGVNLKASDPEKRRPAPWTPKASASEASDAKEVEVSSPSLDEIPLPNFEPARKSFRVPAIAAVAFLIVGGLSLWFAMSGTKATAVDPTVQPAASVKHEDGPAATEAPIVSEQAPTSTQDQSISTASQPSSDGQKHPQVSSVPEKQKKSAAEKPATTKKKVTVDDLINDN